MRCFCGREFDERRTLKTHIKRTHFGTFSDLELEQFVCNELYGKEVVELSIKMYINEEVCAFDLSKTTNIIELLKLMGIKRSNSEEKKTKRYKEKYQQTMKLRYGDGITNPSQLSEVQKKKEITFSEKYGSYERYLEIQRNCMKRGFEEYILTKEKIKETVKKIEDTCFKKYGHKNFGCGDVAKKKRIKKQKETIATWEYEERLERTSKARECVNHRGGYSSKPEKRIRHCLTELDVDFKTNVHLWNYNYDLVFEKFIIEVQGDMWHGNPLKYNPDDLIMGKILVSDLWEKDRKKKCKAEENEFVLIEIWECDIIKKSNSELVIFVKQLLEENGYEFS